jgi:sulfate adenylyltransferase subunit 2
MSHNIEILVKKSIYIVREANAQFDNPCVLWSTGKDSTVMLNIIREAFLGKIPWDVYHIDTGWKFPEIYNFRDEIARKWDLKLKISSSELAGKINPTKRDIKITHQKCCQKLKTDMLRALIETNDYDAVVTSIRRDEHYMRNIERVASPRDKQFRWRFLREKTKDEEGDAPFESLQDTQLWDLIESDFGKDTHHVRIHPFLTNPPWTEKDVWEYIKLRDLPYNPLYRADYVGKKYPEWEGKRFRSLGCYTCTTPIPSKASTVDEILSELEKTEIGERSGRAQDKESEQVMRKLRSMGYI